MLTRATGCYPSLNVTSQVWPLEKLRSFFKRSLNPKMAGQGVFVDGLELETFETQVIPGGNKELFWQGPS
jgi:hypothetical protein